MSIEDVANKEGIIVHELSKDENYEENPSAIDKVNIAETPEINNPPVSNNPYPWISSEYSSRQGYQPFLR